MQDKLYVTGAIKLKFNFIMNLVYSIVIEIILKANSSFDAEFILIIRFTYGNILVPR